MFSDKEQHDLGHPGGLLESPARGQGQRERRVVPGQAEHKLRSHGQHQPAGHGRADSARPPAGPAEASDGLLLRHVLDTFNGYLAHLPPYALPEFCPDEIRRLLSKLRERVIAIFAGRNGEPGLRQVEPDELGDVRFVFDDEDGGTHGVDLRRLAGSCFEWLSSSPARRAALAVTPPGRPD